MSSIPASIHAYRVREATLTQAAYERKIRIINTTIGAWRTFSGTIRTTSAPCTIAAENKTLELYCDGSLRSNGWCFNDVLGAGIAWQEGAGDEEVEEGEIIEEDWRSTSFPLGASTGDATDAELFGVAAALRFAVKRVEDGEGIRLVRVYTDCLRVLQGLQDGSIAVLGPAIGRTWALQEAYDSADQLVGKGIRVELVWVKGHSGVEGNELADKAAKAAVRNQMEEWGVGDGKRRMVRKRDVPADIMLAGEDTVEEWYWRVNMSMLLKGEVEVEDDEEGLSDGSQAMDISDNDDDSD